VASTHEEEERALGATVDLPLPSSIFPAFPGLSLSSTDFSLLYFPSFMQMSPSNYGLSASPNYEDESESKQTQNRIPIDEEKGAVNSLDGNELSYDDASSGASIINAGTAKVSLFSREWEGSCTPSLLSLSFELKPLLFFIPFSLQG